MKTIDFIKNNQNELLNQDELKNFLLRFETMHEAWAKSQNIHFLFAIAKIEKLLTNDKTSLFAIAISERYSYKIFHDETHEKNIESAKKWLLNKNDHNYQNLCSAIKNSNTICKFLSDKSGNYEKNITDKINKKFPTPEELNEFNNINKVTWPDRMKRLIISSSRAAAYATYYENLDEVITVTMMVIEDLKRADFYNFNYDSELCHVFRSIYENPFERYYNATTFTEWFNRSVYERIFRFLIRNSFMEA